MKHASVDRAKRVSSQCRNNNQCPYCRRSRTLSKLKTAQLYRERFREWMRGLRD